MNGFAFGGGFDRHRLIVGLLLAATALFLMAVAPGFPYRRVARMAALAVYGVVFAGVVVWAALWLAGVAPGR